MTQPSSALEPLGVGNTLIDARTGMRTTWAGLPDFEIPEPAAVVVEHSFDAAAPVLAHARTGAELLVVAAERLGSDVRDELVADGFNLVRPSGVTAAPDAHPPQTGRLWLLTSGSTGRPKRIGHTLASLTTVPGKLPARRWLCPYSPGTYAWWQMVTLGLGSSGQDLVMVDPADLETWVDAGVTHGVTAASGTPTFWRRTIMADRERLAEVPLSQITLGGEPVDQAILDQLREIFPHARVSWIYASSEVGASIVVHDGRAGFPVEWLNRAVDGRPVIAIENGELVISSPHHGDGLADAIRTGDAVLIEDDRVLITGRLDSDEINVGGAKISAGVIRSVLQSHPKVAWAHVRGRKSPLVGSLVVAEVVLDSGAVDDPGTVTELGQWCRVRLPEYGIPRRIRLREAIPAKETLKSDV